MMYGDDFYHDPADVSFEFMDKLIRKNNEHSDKRMSGTIKSPKINLKYSTMTDYFDAVKSHEPNLKVMKEDFFPLVD
jgi:flagellar basal body rod protein FlgC